MIKIIPNVSKCHSSFCENIGGSNSSLTDESTQNHELTSSPSDNLHQPLHIESTASSAAPSCPQEKFWAAAVQPALICCRFKDQPTPPPPTLHYYTSVLK